ncbi:ABC transporter permease [Streptomyces sp. NPDC006602]|uniref:ABC transporter permease n=1 Tax=Streptomyces sp. NPDC006602 TaxID=3364751 RepID=UPI00369F9D9D
MTDKTVRHIDAPASDRSTRDRLTPGRLLSWVSGYETLVLLALLMVVFTLSSDRFLTADNLQNVALVQAVTATMTLAVLMPLIIGEFDLSVGYLIGFLVMLEAVVAQHTSNPVLIIAAGPVVGLLVGLVNGVLTVYFKISSFIATLGVGILLSGGTQGISNGKVIFENIPSSVTTLASEDFLGLSLAVWLTLLLAVILFYVLEHTPHGRFWYAIGGSERVAYLAGVRTNRMRMTAFAAAGLIVGVAANFALAQAGSANPGYGPELLLPAYAAAFLGVATYRPGYYNVLGALVAIILLAIGFNGLSLLGVPFWVQPIFNGSVLIIAVLVARQETRQVRTG